MLENNTKYKIGQRIRNVRKQKQLTQAEFAEGIDVSVNFISEIENGKKGLSCDTLYNICQTYNISADDILFGHNEISTNYSTIIDISNTLSDNDISTLIEYLSALLKLRSIH